MNKLNGQTMTIQHLKKIANQAVKEICMFSKLDNKNIWLDPINQELLDIEILMHNFLDNPTIEGVDGLISAKSWINKHTKKIDRFFEKNYMELPRKFTEKRRDGSFNGMCTAVFSNVVSDAEKVKEFLTSTE